MLAQKRKFGFLLVAILAIITSTFRPSLEGTDFTAASHHSHSTKHSYSSLQISSVLYDIEEDSEIESGEEANTLIAIAGTFVHFDFSSLQLALAKEAFFRRDDSVYSAYSQPLYLLNSNFRL